MNPKNRNVAYLILLMMFTSILGCWPIPVVKTSDDLTISIENLSDLLNHIKAIEIHFNDYDENFGVFKYEIVGEETFQEDPTWKVEAEFGEEGDMFAYTLWVSKATGEAVKAEIDGEVLTGVFAGMFGNATLAFWMSMTYSFWMAWDYGVVQELPSEYGAFTYLGSEHRSYGPTTLLIYKYKFEGYPVAPEVYRFTVESWVAPTQFGGVTAYLHIESMDESEWFEWELISIELVESLSLPEVSVGSPEASSASVNPGEELTLSIEVSNDGGSFAIFHVPLVVDGEIKDSKAVTLEAGEKKSVSFTLSFSEEGTHDVEIGGKAFEISVGGAEPASFSFRDLRIEPSSLEAGGTVAISIRVTNVGGSSGSHVVALVINDELEDEKTVSLNPDEGETVRFEVSATELGEFSVEVEGLSGSFTASKPGEEKKPSGGIPGFPYESIIIGLVTGAFVLWLIQRRR